MSVANSRSTSAASGGDKPKSRKRASASSANSETRPCSKASENDSSKDSFANANSCPLGHGVGGQRSTHSSWTYLASFTPTGTVRCASVGWLIRDDDQMKAVAPNMGSINDERSLQVSGVIQIPTSCVLRITQLSEPGFTA